MKVKPWARMLRGLIVVVLAATGTAAVTVPAHAGTMVVYNSAPAAGSVVIGPGCTNVHQYTYGFSGNWQSTGSGDYTGSGVYGQASSRSCTGTTDYILDQATQTAQFRWHLETFCATGCTPVPCKIWAYIPTADAGDYHARYDFWADDGNGNLSWLAWPGGNVDQEDNSGWAYLGQVTVGNTHILTISLNNQDAAEPGWYAGAGDVAVSCPAQQVIPAVPARLQTDGTGTTTPTLSAVVQSASGGQVTGNIYLTGSTGNAIGGAPTATGVVSSGDRIIYTVPAGVLANGGTYSWDMTACQGAVCSAASPAQTFTIQAAATSPPPGAVSTTITGSAIAASDAIITPGACSGADCATVTDGLLKVGNDGTNPWRSALKIDLSSIPPGSRIVSATLDLTEAGCLNGCPGNGTLTVYPADSDVTAQSTGPSLAAAADSATLGSGPVSPVNIDITAAVAAWFSGQQPDDGLILQAEDESAATPGVSYYSPTSGAAAADLPSVAVTYLPPTVPGAPAGLTVSAGDGGVSASWTPPGNEGDAGGVTSYTLSAVDSAGTTVASVITSGTHAILSGLTDGTTYSIDVTAANDLGSGQSATVTATPAAVTGGPARYIQAVQQFLTAQDGLENGTYLTASDAAAGASNGPMFAAELQAEAGNDTGMLAGLASQGLAQTVGVTTLSDTLVVPSGTSVLVDTTDDHTYDTVAGQGSASPVSTPGEDVTDYQFTFSTGTTPQLTGYVDADQLSSAAGAASDNADSALLADPAGPGPANLPDPAATVTTNASGNISVGSEIAPSSVYTPGILQYTRTDWNTGGWPGFPAEDCADFASRALYVGGHLPMVQPWYDTWWFSGRLGRYDKSAWWYAAPVWYLPYNPSSFSWGAAPDLARFLSNKSNYFFTNLGDVTAGDLLFANWDGTGGFSGIDHVGIVTEVTHYGGQTQIYITQHTPKRYNESLTRWLDTDNSGNYDGKPNANLRLYAVRVVRD